MASEDISSLDTIRDLKRREPFQPFVVVMTSGDRFRIESGDALAIGSSQLHSYPPMTDRVVHMRLSQISTVEAMGEGRLLSSEGDQLL